MFSAIRAADFVSWDGVVCVAYRDVLQRRLPAWSPSTIDRGPRDINNGVVTVVRRCLFSRQQLRPQDLCRKGNDGVRVQPCRMFFGVYMDLITPPRLNILLIWGYTPRTPIDV